MRRFSSLLTALLLLIAPGAYASLSVSFSSGSALTVTGGYNDPILQATFHITNTGSQDLTLGLHRQILSEVPGSENSFCFGTGCYPPNVGLAPNPITLAAGATDTSFIGDYTPMGQIGITVVRYAIYDINSLDTAYVTVTYDASRANGLADDLAASSLLSAPVPNPVLSGNMVSLSVAGEIAGSRVLLTSLADGKVVRWLEVSPLVNHCGTIAPGGSPVVSASGGTVSFSTADLSAGLYACMLISPDGRPHALRRLMVR